MEEKENDFDDELKLKALSSSAVEKDRAFFFAYKDLATGMFGNKTELMELFGYFATSLCKHTKYAEDVKEFLQEVGFSIMIHSTNSISDLDGVLKNFLKSVEKLKASEDLLREFCKQNPDLNVTV